MAEHETHAEHLKAENGGESPERTVYVSSVPFVVVAWS